MSKNVKNRLGEFKRKRLKMVEILQKAYEQPTFDRLKRRGV